MFNTFTECEQNYGKCSTTQTSGSSEDDDDDDDDESSNSKRLNTKCLGDFGDGVGDKLCCGQTGVIQNEHVDIHAQNLIHIAEVTNVVNHGEHAIVSKMKIKTKLFYIF